MMKIDRYDDPLESSTLSLNAGVAHAKLIDFKSLGPTKGINYSRDHLRRKWKSGEFPKPIVLVKPNQVIIGEYVGLSRKSTIGLPRGLLSARYKIYR